MTSRTPIPKFCVVTTQRSGSSWLVELLNSHPEIRAFSEVFLNRLMSEGTSKSPLIPPLQFCEFQSADNGRRPRVTSRYLDLLESWADGASIVGFKLMYNQCLVQPEILVEMVRRRYRIIHLRRENHLDVLLSLKRMEETGVAHRLTHSPGAGLPVQPVYLNPRKLRSRLARQSMLVGAARLVLKLSRLPVLDVAYDALCNDHARSMREIARHLFVSSDHAWRSSVEKMSGGSHRQEIANYDEVEAALSGTKFEALLRG